MAVKTKTLSRHVATLRIAFGIIWAIDAVFKWRPSFENGFIDQINSAAQSHQASWLNPWFNFWTHFLSHNPHLFAMLIAGAESLIAIALLIGLARRTTYIVGVIFSLLIWGVAEGFG